MPRISDREIARHAYDAGFRGGPLVVAVAIALAESGGNTAARGRNPDSVDRGLWQINSKWHPEVSNACADNPECAAKQAYRISGGGKSWSPWTTFKTGAYRAFNPRATAAAKGVDVYTFQPPKLGTLDKIGTKLPGLPGPLVDAADAARATGRLVLTLLNPNFWKRVIMILGGGLAMIAGVYLLVRGEVKAR